MKLNMNLHTQATARKSLVFLPNRPNLKMLSSVFEYGVSNFTCSACIISSGLFTPRVHTRLNSEVLSAD